MNKRIAVSMILFIIICAVVFGGGGKEPTESGGKISLRLAHSYPVSNHWHKGSELAANLVRERTKGGVDIKIFTDSQLGTEEQITEQVIFGSIDIGVSGAGQIGNLFKPINVTEMPFTFKDNDHVLRFARSEIAQKMFSDLEYEYKLKVLGCSSYGIRQIISKNPVRTPEDLKGLKFRVPEQNIWIEVIKSMGASPTPIAYVETYMALQQGVVDALDNPLSGIRSMKFYEVAKNIAKTSHVTVVCYFLMNGETFKKMEEKRQAVLLDSFNEASRHIVDILNKEDRELGEFFTGQGLTIIQPDIEAFRKLTAQMPAKYRKQWIRYGEDLHQKIQGL